MQARAWVVAAAIAMAMTSSALGWEEADRVRFEYLGDQVDGLVTEVLSKDSMYKVRMITGRYRGRETMVSHSRVVSGRTTPQSELLRKKRAEEAEKAGEQEGPPDTNAREAARLGQGKPAAPTAKREKPSSSVILAPKVVVLDKNTGKYVDPVGDRSPLWNIKPVENAPAPAQTNRTIALTCRSEAFSQRLRLLNAPRCADLPIVCAVNRPSGDELTTWLQVADIAAGKPSPVLDVAGLLPFAVSADGKTLLASAKDRIRGIPANPIHVLRLESPAGPLASVVQVNLPEANGDLFGWIVPIDANHLLVAGSGYVRLYALDRQHAVYQIKVDGNRVSYDPLRGYLIVTTATLARANDADGRAATATLTCVIDVLTGDVVGRVASRNYARQAAISPDGRLLGVLGSEIAIIEPAANRELSRLYVRYDDSRLAWLDDRFVAMIKQDRALVYDTKIHVPVWQVICYQSQGAVCSDRGAISLSVPPDRNQAATVTFVPLKLPALVAAAEKVNPASLLVLQPGAAVKLDVKSERHPQEVQAVLRRRLTAVGLRIDPQAPIVAQAVTEYNSVAQEYRAGPNEKITVDVSGVTARLTFLDAEGKVVWGTSESRGVPSIIRPKPGQSLQDAVNDMLKDADVEVAIFEHLSLPGRVLNPNYGKMIASLIVKEK